MRIEIDNACFFFIYILILPLLSQSLPVGALPVSTR